MKTISMSVNDLVKASLTTEPYHPPPFFLTHCFLPSLQLEQSIFLLFGELQRADILYWIIQNENAMKL